MLKIAKVVLPIALDKEFDYAFSADLAVKKGMRVLVDFKGRKRVALVTAIAASSRIKNLKTVIDKLDQQPLLTKEHFQFAGQLAKIYPYPQAEFLFMMVPFHLRKLRKSTLPESKEQNLAANHAAAIFIKADDFAARYQYWQAEVREKLNQGSVLICFPQLSYLERAKEILEKDFAGKVYVLHSQESEKELSLNWENSRKNALLIGSRAAIFYYPSDLKLIIVEQENNPYYYQQEKPFYHLREVALLLAKLRGIKLILSGDYPSLTIYRQLKDKKIALVEKESNGPEMKVVGLSEFGKKKVIGPFCPSC